jgi:uncharacterized protein YqgV (UPF0045/DUF77 family)
VTNFQTLLISDNADVSDVLSDMDIVATTTTLDTSDPLVLLAGGVAFLSFAGLMSLMDTAGDDEEADEKEKTPIILQESSSTSVAAPSGEVEKDEPRVGMPEENLTEEESEALDAFKAGNEGRLRGTLSKLVSIIRAGKASLGEEKKLRFLAEAKLKEVTQEMIDIEDKYELEQNALQRKTRDLQQTEATLEDTLKVFKKAEESLSELEAERQSLRKLARVAWQLSKGRVQNRVQNVRDRFKKSESVDFDNEEDKK